MPEPKKFYYKEAQPEKGKFHSNAEDGYFMQAEPLTDADRAKAAAMWDKMVISSEPAEQDPEQK
jgi:hypothetical protein